MGCCVLYNMRDDFGAVMVATRLHHVRFMTSIKLYAMRTVYMYNMYIYGVHCTVMLVFCLNE